MADQDKIDQVHGLWVNFKDRPTYLRTVVRNYRCRKNCYTCGTPFSTSSTEFVHYATLASGATKFICDDCRALVPEAKCFDKVNH
jgi:hypothetical protein